MTAKILIFHAGSVGWGIDALSFVMEVSNMIVRIIIEVTTNKALLGV